MSKNKSINVKIATVKVINALEIKLAKTKADFAKQGENEANYQKEYAKWRKEIGKWALEQIAKAQNLRTNYRSWNNTINIDFDLPTNEKDFPQEPERNYEEIHRSAYNEMIEQLENSIRILKMTDDEFINTSTYNSIAKYL